jgi:hypothetical protein
MTKGATVGLMTVIAHVLLATMTSAYANHIATGAGTYAVPSVTTARFQFTVAARPSERSPSIPVTTAKVNVEVVNEGESTAFQLFLFSTAIDSFDIDTDEGIDFVTIKGKLLSTLVLGEGPDREHFTEIAGFVAEGEDAETPGAGVDSFALTVSYSASEDQAQRFVDLGLCADATTCTIVFEGTLVSGEITIHSAGDE